MIPQHGPFSLHIVFEDLSLHKMAFPTPILRSLDDSQGASTFHGHGPWRLCEGTLQAKANLKTSKLPNFRKLFFDYYYIMHGTLSLWHTENSHDLVLLVTRVTIFLAILVGWSWSDSSYIVLARSKSRAELRPTCVFVGSMSPWIFFWIFFWRHKADKPSPKHMRKLTIKQVFCQVQWRFHSRDSNRQPLSWDLSISPPSPNSLGSTRT